MKYGIFAIMVKHFLKKPIFNCIKREYPELLSREYKREVKKHYKDIIKRTEGLGGLRKNSMEFILVFTAYCIAIYKVSYGKMSEELFKTIIDELCSSDLMKKTAKRSSSFSEKSIKNFKKLSEISTDKAYKNKWVSTFEYEEGSEELFITYTECGICKIAKQENVFHLVPYLCSMDYPMFNYKGEVLERTKTLGYGDDCCNFHVMSRKKAESIGFVRGDNAR